MAALILGLIVLTAPAQGGSARPEDPYEAMARKLAFAARGTGMSSLAVAPFRPLDGVDEIGGRLVGERIALRISAGGGLEVLDGRELAGGGRRLSPDGPLTPSLEVELLDEVLRQFEILDLGLQDTADERDRRNDARRALKARQLEASKGAEQRKRRQQEEPPEAQALVTGFLVPLSDGRVEVHARLVNAEKVTVLASVSAQVDKDWGEPAPAATRRDYFSAAGLIAASASALWFLAKAANG